MRTLAHTNALVHQQQHQHAPQPVGMGEFQVIQTPNGPQYVPVGVGQVAQASTTPMSPIMSLVIVGAVAALGFWAYKKWGHKLGAGGRASDAYNDDYVAGARKHRSRARVLAEMNRYLDQVDAGEGAEEGFEDAEEGFEEE